MKNIHILPTDKPSNLTIRYKTKELMYSYKKFINQQSGGITLNTNQNIYITSDEEIKEGDYWIYICHINGLDYGDDNNPIVKNNLPHTWFEKLHDKENYKKIILTTDQELIDDGVQAIDEEFLEWFVKNPSCEEVKIESWQTKGEWDLDYKIIIPKEESTLEQIDQTNPVTKGSTALVHKEETLEKAAEKYANKKGDIPTTELEDAIFKQGFIDGAKWQQEQFKNESTANYIDRHIVEAMVETAKQERMYSEEEVYDLFAQWIAYQQGFPRIDEDEIPNSFRSFNEWFEQFKKK